MATKRENRRHKDHHRYLKQAAREGYVVTGSKVEHRAVWKAAYGFIPKGWVVHHIDFDKTNNTIDNLIALPEAYHNKIHYEMDRGRPRYTRDELWPKYLEYLTIYETLTARLQQAQSIVDVTQGQLDDLGGLSYADKQKYKHKQPVRYVPPVTLPETREFEPKSVLRKKSAT